MSLRNWRFRRRVRFVARLVSKACLYTVLFDLSFIFLFPFINMIFTSIKSPEALLDVTVRWIPSAIHWENYSMAIYLTSFPILLKNSAIVTSLSTLGHVLACSFIAYGFARFKFPGRDALFMLVILTIIIPVEVIILPLYVNYESFKILDTYLPITLPTFFGLGLRGGIFIFIFRQFYVSLPYELEDAALMDGCGFFRTYRSIALPMAKTAILVSSVLSVVWHWNDYLEPSMYILSPRKVMLPSVLPTLQRIATSYIEQPGAQVSQRLYLNEAVNMAAIFLTLLPLIIVYLILQRRFVEGIERTGLVG